MNARSPNRKPFFRLGRLTIYKVKLLGGPFDGCESICSGDNNYHGGERYVRGADDLYRHAPEQKTP